MLLKYALALGVIFATCAFIACCILAYASLAEVDSAFHVIIGNGINQG